MRVQHAADHNHRSMAVEAGNASAKVNLASLNRDPTAPGPNYRTIGARIATTDGLVSGEHAGVRAQRMMQTINTGRQQWEGLAVQRDVKTSRAAGAHWQQRPGCRLTDMGHYMQRPQTSGE